MVVASHSRQTGGNARLVSSQMEDEAQLLGRVTALCCDTDRWVTERISSWKNRRSTNMQRFSSSTGGKGRPEVEPADPGSSGKMAVKWN